MPKTKPKAPFRDDATLEDMLAVKDLKDLLADGDLFDIHGACAKTGYSRDHLTRLCASQIVGHFQIGTGRTSPFYFAPRHLRAVYREVPVRVKRVAAQSAANPR